jgi:DNA excision repair protein ERCC-8
MWRCISARELGDQWRARPHAMIGARLANMDISTHIELFSKHAAPITSLGLDAAEGRFLLSSASDASLALYDVEDRTCDLKAAASPLSEPLAVITKQHQCAHRLSVSAVQWFPHDTGCFASGGADGVVKLWDTNELTPACDFQLPGRVNCIAMSPTATTHSLIAACTDGSNSVQLCDPVTGSAAQVLVGHRKPPWALCWNPRREHELVSGGADRSVRVWDVRRAGACLRSLDQHDSTEERHRLAGGGGGGGERGGGGSGGGGGGGDGSSSSSGSGSRRKRATGSTTVAAAARELATPTAHDAPVTSVTFAADGLFILTAGRDHRMRLWNADSGANTLVHYADAFNTCRGHKQIGVSAAGGSARDARVYFPAAEGLRVYELLSGRTVKTLKGHLGEASCCTAATWDACVFSGGADAALLAWTPPPCGLTQPTPQEKPWEREREPAEDFSVPLAVARVDLQHGGDGGSGGGTSRLGASAGAHAQVVVEDGDAWSDSEEEEGSRAPPPRAVARKRRRR